MKKSVYRKQSGILRVAVVEDHQLVRHSLVVTLKKEPQVVVACQASNGQEFLDQLADHAVDVVLLDLDMPVLNGLETLKLLRKNHPSVQVILLSMHEDPWIVSELLREGARSFLKKDCSFDELMDALFDVHYKGFHSNELVSSSFFAEVDQAHQRQQSILKFELNERELAVLKLICDGKTSDEIAQRIHVSKKTIDAIRSHLLKRIGAQNATELARKSTLLGLYTARTDAQIQAEEQLEDQERTNRKRARMTDFPLNDSEV
jgi:DNA-binding NarL/FixJ family response regulator